MDIKLNKEHRAAIEDFMIRNDLNVFSWCNKAGISEGTLRSFLKGNTQSMKMITLNKLASAANTDLMEILGNKKRENNNNYKQENFEEILNRISSLEQNLLNLAIEVAYRNTAKSKNPNRKNKA